MNMTKKKVWTIPSIQVVSIHEAEGAQPGALCDKHGSLSSATNAGLGGTC
jgi:hypothetical protein